MNLRTYQGTYFRQNQIISSYLRAGALFRSIGGPCWERKEEAVLSPGVRKNIESPCDTTMGNFKGGACEKFRVRGHVWIVPHAEKRPTREKQAA